MALVAPLAGMALVLLAACDGDGGAAPITATATITSTETTAGPGSATSTSAAVTATPAIEEEVAAAYLAYWDAYSEAVLNLDASLVEGVAVGEELESIREEIAELEADGVALRVVVEHDLLVVPQSAVAATVVDEVTNNSFYVDPVTKEPPEAEGSGEQTRYTFFLQEVDGRWVVARGLREPAE